MCSVLGWVADIWLTDVLLMNHQLRYRWMCEHAMRRATDVVATVRKHYWWWISQTNTGLWELCWPQSVVCGSKFVKQKVSTPKCRICATSHCLVCQLRPNRPLLLTPVGLSMLPWKQSRMQSDWSWVFTSANPPFAQNLSKSVFPPQLKLLADCCQTTAYFIQIKIWILEEYYPLTKMKVTISLRLQKTRLNSTQCVCFWAANSNTPLCLFGPASVFYTCVFCEACRNNVKCRFLNAVGLNRCYFWGSVTHCEPGRFLAAL